MRVALSSAGRTAVLVHVTLAAQVLAMAALVIFEETRGGRLAQEIAAVGGDPRAPGAEEIMGEVTLFAILVLTVIGTTAAAVAAYLTWLSRVRRSAVWAWLVPGVNLIAPPFALHAIWDAAGPPERRRRRWLVLATGWWLSWLTALAMIVTPASGDGAGLTGLGSAELTATALAAALCAATVREITYVRAARRPATTGSYLMPLRGLESAAGHSHPAGK